MIVFLDFDGPCFPLKTNYLPENKDQENAKELGLYPFETLVKMDWFMVYVLNKIDEIEGCEIVISSSWADIVDLDKNVFQRLFEFNGIKPMLHKDWKTPRVKIRRSDQILEWLSLHHEKKYLIFDDIESGFDLIDHPEIDQDHLMIVSMNDGLALHQYHHLLKKIV